jgi:hypothetical protein
LLKTGEVFYIIALERPGRLLQVTFTAFLTDGSEGIYVADIAFPVLEPADLNGSSEVDVYDLYFMAG